MKPTNVFSDNSTPQKMAYLLCLTKNIRMLTLVNLVFFLSNANSIVRYRIGNYYSRIFSPRRVLMEYKRLLKRPDWIQSMYGNILLIRTHKKSNKNMRSCISIMTSRIICEGKKKVDENQRLKVMIDEYSIGINFQYLILSEYTYL